MALKYKIKDLTAMLKEKGYSTYTLRQKKIFGESTIQKLREGKPISWENIETLCELLDIQPSELLVFEKETKNTTEN